jgi:hypothetical protein
MGRALVWCLLLTACSGEPQGPGEVDGGGSDPSVDLARQQTDGDMAGSPGADMTQVFPSGVPTFFAIGKFARITSSCDDAQTWSFNQSDNDGASCVGIDCDHHPGSATGVTVGDGYFFASFGWGDHPSRIFRSKDGRVWDKAYELKSFSFAGIAWASDRLIGGDATPRYSLDHGTTWKSSPWPAYQVPMGAWPNARQVGWSPFSGGRIALVAGEGSGAWGDTVVSSNSGAAYVHPTALPAECKGYSRPLAYGNGIWVQVWAGSGVICRSSDGGDHWTASAALPANAEVSHTVFTGSEFIVYAGNKGYRSSDGTTWTAFNITVPGGAQLGAVAHSPVTGTFAAVRGGWDVWYDKQRFYRSSDGVTWTELPLTAAKRSHPITHMSFGWAAASAACP